jgi:hypothetical protein
MTAQHLSDEAVAAFADGVLSGHARERAARHINACAECGHAVKIQREAAFALRSSLAPDLPSALLDRLRTVPMTTPITTLPTAVAPDGTTMLSTFAPMAALVPDQSPRTHRARPFVTTAAVVAMAGTLAAGSLSHQNQPAQIGTGHVIGRTTSEPGGQTSVINPVSYFRGAQP